MGSTKTLALGIGGEGTCEVVTGCSSYANQRCGFELP